VGRPKQRLKVKTGIEVILLENEIIDYLPTNTLVSYGDGDLPGWRKLQFKIRGVVWTIEFSANRELKGRLPREYTGKLRRILGIDPPNSAYCVKTDDIY